MKSTKLFTILCILGLLVASFASAKLEDGLISVWTFDDGSAKDSIGNNNGKMHGGVAPIAGKHGKGMSFDGVDGYIDVPHDKSMEAIAEGLTVSAWIYIRKGADHGAVIFKGEKIGWTNNYAFRIASHGGDTGLTWGICIPGTEGYFHTDGSITPNEWWLVCLTGDGKQAVGRVAQEGGKVEIPPSGQGNPHPIAAPYRTTPDFPIEMGVGRAVGGTVGNDAFLDAIIDEVYLWDRALSDDEIKQLADGARPKGLAVEPSGKMATFWGDIKKAR